MTVVAATGATAWILLIGAAVAGVGFGAILNTLLAKRRRRR